MINLLLLNNFYPASSKRKRRIIVHDLVTRYGPRTSCQRKGLKIHDTLWPSRRAFTIFFYSWNICTIIEKLLQWKIFLNLLQFGKHRLYIRLCWSLKNLGLVFCSFENKAKYYQKQNSRKIPFENRSTGLGEWFDHRVHFRRIQIEIERNENVRTNRAKRRTQELAFLGVYR